MENQALTRKLAAIFYADVAGYSRLTGLDEEGTHRRLSQYLDLMVSEIEARQGKALHFAGDAVLAEFSSVVDAVTVAVELQRELAERNQDVDDEHKLNFRMGINLGDVIVDRNELFGDGVNIAARLESLAEPGGICISGSVVDAIGTKLHLDYKSMGEQVVKNIARPVRAFQVALLEDPPSNQQSDVKKASLLENPSIAVMPFVNMSPDQEQEFFVDGMTEDIITALSKISRLFVISRNSVFTYKGRHVDIKQVAHELNVRYVLEGSARKAGMRVRVTAQLIDATTGQTLWSERYDRDLTDVFALQDELTRNVVTSLQVQLVEGEQARVWQRSTTSLEAWDCLNQGLAKFRRFIPGENLKARQLLERAIGFDAEYLPAKVWLGWTHWADVRYLWVDTPDISLEKAKSLAEEVLAQDENMAEANSLLGAVHLINQKFDEAIASGEKAVELDPNGADVTALLAMTLNWAGRPEESIGLLRKAMGLSPVYSAWYLAVLAHSQRLMEQHDAAIVTYLESIQRSPRNISAHIGLAVTYSELGRDEEARLQAQEILRIKPDFQVKKYANSLTYKNPDHAERALNALRKAGVPE